MKTEIKFDYSKYDFKVESKFEYLIKGKLNRKIVDEISKIKSEPEWMTKIRLKAFDHFIKRSIPKWGPDLSEIPWDNLIWFAKPKAKKSERWEDLPENIRKTFEKLGIPEAERKFLAGVGAQFESEVVYHNLQKQLKKQGVIFTDMDTALKEYPEIVKKYFGTVVPYNDNKFAALNTALWSGGSFVYVPEGVEVKLPLQAYFRINAKNMGQFERTLIIAEPHSKVHYIEGCTAPIYASNSLHAAVVEIIAMKGSKVRYTTIQNWSNDVYNLVTKRAYAYENSIVEWLDGNIGSKVTMKYPSVYLLGKNAKADILSIAFAGKGQHQDSGGKALHLAPNTQSKIISKSICKDGGRTSYRGLVYVAKGAKNVKSSVRCDALILDDKSQTDTYPYNEVYENDATIAHEATVGKIGEDQIFYLTSRGLSEIDALSMIVNGFIEIFTKELPMEYAVELNKLIRLEMEGAVG
jgi:Fe-S cluster assembly protein SufB